MPKFREDPNLYDSVKQKIEQLKNEIYDRTVHYESMQASSEQGMDRFLHNLKEKLDDKQIWMNPDKLKGIEKKVRLSQLKGKNPLLNELINFWKSEAWNDP